MNEIKPTAADLDAAMREIEDDERRSMQMLAGVLVWTVVVVLGVALSLVLPVLTRAFYA